ncbi:hypothetical protein J8281_18005 [Aquimarina sp. U1-2]|uniref:hypothetical protein n=1 Tax=Aquimarina sp. U1-2 TaxID=2823141 RepID=UPI001AEC89F9|nr:hypothetical protein [Aquimarina sp. U1-2]MBP2834096.1 hypothetical protein [Aquimarina sp. U1-2]
MKNSFQFVFLILGIVLVTLGIVISNNVEENYGLIVIVFGAVMLIASIAIFFVKKNKK